MGLPFTSSSAKKRDQVLAIDLGSRTTKAVQLQVRGDKYALLNYAIIETPAADKALSAEQLTEHLRNVAGQMGGKLKKVTLALGVNETLFRQVEVPVMPVNDIRQMLKFNAKIYLQQDLPDYVYDCFCLPPRAPQRGADGKPAPQSGPQKLRVLVGGAKRTFIDSISGSIRNAGLLPDQVVPGLIGPANAFEVGHPEAFQKETVALVDVGFKNSSISILDGGQIILNRVVAIGGDKITANLAETMSIGYQEAECIKVGMPTEVQQALEAVISPLGRELRASIDFFEHQHDKQVSQAFISGGSARSDYLVSSLQNELMVPCKSWNPAQSLELSLAPEKLGEFEQVAPQLAVAIGAALSGM